MTICVTLETLFQRGKKGLFRAILPGGDFIKKICVIYKLLLNDNICVTLKNLVSGDKKGLLDAILT